MKCNIIIKITCLLTILSLSLSVKLTTKQLNIFNGSSVATNTAKANVTSNPALVPPRTPEVSNIDKLQFNHYPNDSPVPRVFSAVDASPIGVIQIAPKRIILP